MKGYKAGSATKSGVPMRGFTFPDWKVSALPGPLIGVGGTEAKTEKHLGSAKRRPIHRARP